jgi:hypothetical protein
LQPDGLTRILSDFATDVPHVDFDGAFIGLADVRIFTVIIAAHYPYKVCLRPYRSSTAEKLMKQVEFTSGEAQFDTINRGGTGLRNQDKTVVFQLRTLWFAGSSSNFSQGLLLLVPDTGTALHGGYSCP